MDAEELFPALSKPCPLLCSIPKQFLCQEAGRKSFLMNKIGSTLDKNFDFYTASRKLSLRGVKKFFGRFDKDLLYW
jgi:hypothetical protein